MPLKKRIKSGSLDQSRNKANGQIARLIFFSNFPAHARVRYTLDISPKYQGFFQFFAEPTFNWQNRIDTDRYPIYWPMEWDKPQNTCRIVCVYLEPDLDPSSYG